MTTTTILMASATALILAAPASAAVVLPTNGSVQYGLEFADDEYVLERVFTPDFSTFLEIGPFILELASTSAVEFALRDCCALDREFRLAVNEVETPFTATGFDPQGNFEAVYAATLAAGSYLFLFRSFNPSDEGVPARAFGTFEVSPVPLPAAAPLLALALGGVGLAARRRRAA